MAFYPSSIPTSSGFYFRDSEEKKVKKTSIKQNSTESSTNLLDIPQIKTPSKDVEINPFAYAMASIYSRSHPSSRANTPAQSPAPSRPVSVHREDKELNPYAYAMGSIYKRSHSRSRSTTPAQSRAASVHREEAADKEINPTAYALQNSWMWRRSFSRSPSANNSRASSVAPATQ